MFKSNKNTNFNKKIHFKSPCLCIVRIVWFTDMIHIYVSDDSWALTIRLYDMKLFVHDTIHNVYRTILTTMIVGIWGKIMKKQEIGLLTSINFPFWPQLGFLRQMKELAPFYLRRYVSTNHISSVGCIFPSTHSIEKFLFV